MNQILEFFPADRMVRVQAGVVTEQLQNYAEEQGMYYPVDFASTGSSQIGGNIGTNAGGIKVIKYGMTRNWVLGLTVVTGKGDILRLNKGMIKMPQVMHYSIYLLVVEGTLGLVTEAEIKLERQPHNLQVMVLGTPDFEAVMPVLHAFKKEIDLTAFEFFGEVAMQKCWIVVMYNVHLKQLVHSMYYSNLKHRMNQSWTKQCRFLSIVWNKGWVIDGVMSQSLEQAQSLWRLREDISESIAPYIPYKNDISVLITHVPAFIAEIDAIVADNYPDFEICWFGHIGDGNLHLNILKPENLTKDEFFAKCQVVNKYVFETVKNMMVRSLPSMVWE